MQVVLFILGIIIQCFVDACIRKSPKPTTTVQPTTTFPLISSTTAAPIKTTFTCTDKEKGQSACLNDGECFATMLGRERVAACKCPETYTGRRCEALNYLPVGMNEQLKIAGIAAGVTSCVFILILVLGITLVYFKRRRKEARDQNNTNQEASHRDQFPMSNYNEDETQETISLT